jgi:hypothetical protein
VDEKNGGAGARGREVEEYEFKVHFVAGQK